MIYVQPCKPFKTIIDTVTRGNKMNIETKVMFTNIDKPELGILTWNQISTFTIYDSNMTEIDQFHVYGIDTVAQARKIASDHFKEVMCGQDY